MSTSQEGQQPIVKRKELEMRLNFEQQINSKNQLLINRQKQVIASQKETKDAQTAAHIETQQTLIDVATAITMWTTFYSTVRQ